MGANRSGKNLRQKRKRHQRNLRTYAEAVEKRENPQPPAKISMPAKKAAKTKTAKTKTAKTKTAKTKAAKTETAK